MYQFMKFTQSHLEFQSNLQSQLEQLFEQVTTQSNELLNGKTLDNPINDKVEIEVKDEWK